ncbi:MAG: GGDEF domain-containing protein, partial [Clostridiales bacterium]|nr:GGDEF domain-containing protein [Clostridiales bacterium]
NDFVKHLSNGELEEDLPGRRNYLAGPIKQLHSHMTNFVWISQQLVKGKVVDKMEFAGDFGNAVNQMIDLILYGVKEGQSAEKDVENGAYLASNYQYYQLYMALNHLSMMILEVDESGKVIFANKLARRTFVECEYFTEDAVPERMKDFVADLTAMASSQDNFPIFSEQNTAEPETGKSQWYKITIDRIQFPNRENLLMYIMEDITEQKFNEQSLVKDATIDFLSNASNRKMGMVALEAALTDKMRYSEYVAAFLDINKLKNINDTYGHIEGDYAIKTIAEVLLSTVRSTDVVSRFGGDEFLIVFAKCNLTNAECIMTRMHQKLDAINEKRIKPYKLSFSHGAVEIMRDSGLSAKDIIMILDKKMYERKSAERAEQM